MFLATTADDRFWHPEARLLFLGKWCLRYSRRGIWASRDYEILPYHWDRRDRLEKDAQYLWDLQERLLPVLRDNLNHLHGENHDLRYWRIILGPWLYHALAVFYDRFLSIQMAVDSGRVRQTRVVEYSPGTWIFRDFSDFLQASFEDRFNLVLYSRLLRALKPFPMETVDFYPAENSPTERAESVKTKLRFLAGRFFSALVPDSLNAAVCVATYFSPRDLFRLQLRLGQAPYLVSPSVPAPQPVYSPEMRHAIHLPPSDNPFESLLQDLIREFLPSVCVEGYAAHRSEVLKRFPRRPRLVFTANALIAREDFKFWAAHHAECGVPLAATQHGGLYGIARWYHDEQHEIEVSDRYLSWGWRIPGKPGVAPLPSPFLTPWTRGVQPDSSGDTLWVFMSLPRYAYMMYSVPVASQVWDYFEDQRSFFLSLDPQIQGRLLAKPYRLDYGWDFLEWMKDWPVRPKIYTGRASLKSLLNRCRLFVGTYNATTYLETFSANFPTVLFWNPAHWEIREAARPFFDQLKQAGILHPSPQSAARQVDLIYQDPGDWWYSKEVQEARQAFCHRFARTRRDWLGPWVSEFKNLMKHPVSPGSSHPG